MTRTYSQLNRNSLCNLFQNSPVICCTLLHCLRQYISACPNPPGGGIITLVFVVSILEGHIGFRLLPSFKSYVVNGWELSNASTSVINVVRASSSKLVPWVLSSDDNGSWLFYLHSHTPPAWLAVGVSLVQSSQSATFSWRKCLILVWFISWNTLLSSLSVPTKLVPLSLLMLPILPLLAIILQSATINECFHCSHNFNVNCPAD